MGGVGLNGGGGVYIVGLPFQMAGSDLLCNRGVCVFQSSDLCVVGEGGNLAGEKGAGSANKFRCCSAAHVRRNDLMSSLALKRRNHGLGLFAQHSVCVS